MADKNQHIKVFVRVRPLNATERSKNVVDCPGSKDLIVRERPFDKSSKKFAFDKVFGPNCKQIDVYKCVVNPLITEVLAGYNCTVFAYGQTGTGKTFTMEGEKSCDPAVSWQNDPLTGIIPRALSHLFDELRMLQAEHSVKVSFLELYNEELLDLLSPVDDGSKIKLFEDATKRGSVIVHGLEEVTVHNKNEVYQIMEKGSLKRQTAATLMNAHSSRSHTVFSITVHIKENSVEGDELLKIGKLNLVDLAGSENIGRSGAVDKRAREAGNINQSLLTLGRVITALVERAPHVPYRESKLTRLLQESLGGRTKTSIIATISPSICNLEETLSTLEYAHRAKNIQNRPEINQKLEKKALIKEYTEEIDRLRRDLNATRERNGIYVEQENYYQMLTLIDMQKQEMVQLLGTVKSLEECNEIKEALNQDLTLSLAEYNEKLAQTQENLTETMKLLQETVHDRDEKAHLVDTHVQTEQKLSEQARSLLAVADVSTSHTEKLQDSLERKKLLEKGNNLVCHNFHDMLKHSLASVECDLTFFSQEEIKFANSMKTKLDKSYEKAMAESSVGDKRISSMVQAQTNVVHELDKKSSETGVSQGLTEEMRINLKQEGSAAEKNLQNMLQSVQREIKSLRQENYFLRTEMDRQKEDFSVQIAEHTEMMLRFTVTTLTTVEQLRVDALQKMEQQQQELDRHNAIVYKMKEKKNAFRKEMETQMHTLVKMCNSYDDESNAELEELFQCVSTQRGTCSNTVKTLANLEPHTQKTTEFVSECRMSESKIRNNVVTLTEQVSSRNCAAEQKCVAIMEHIEAGVSSGRSAWQKQTQIVDQGLQDISANLTHVRQDQLKLSQNLVETLQESVVAHEDIKKEQLFHLESLVNTCKADLGHQCNEILNWSNKMVTEVKHLDGEVAKFVKEDLQSYVPTGNTPQRREFQYPRDLAATSPHEHILARFRVMSMPEEEEGSSDSLHSNSIDSPPSSCDAELLSDSDVEVLMVSSMVKSASTNDIPSSSRSLVAPHASEPNIAMVEDKENSKFVVSQKKKHSDKNSGKPAKHQKTTKSNLILTPRN